MPMGLVGIAQIPSGGRYRLQSVELAHPHVTSWFLFFLFTATETAGCALKLGNLENEREKNLR